jgi:cytoskeletal protein RodZ
VAARPLLVWAIVLLIVAALAFVVFQGQADQDPSLDIPDAVEQSVSPSDSGTAATSAAAAHRDATRRTAALGRFGGRRSFGCGPKTVATDEAQAPGFGRPGRRASGVVPCVVEITK